jgi:prephenate dehydrogenase
MHLGALDAAGSDPGAGITFVATPVRAIATTARQALADTTGVVTDVGSVKSSVVAAVDDPRFVGGHPMAGSEQEGVDGADADLFEGAVWVLTPTAATDDSAYATVRNAVTELGAEVVSLSPEHHDALVAVVSHVPHLTAATLMGLADERATEHRALLRLAAGGFRDMTRIAAGHPGIWPDICAENRSAIVEVLDGLVDSLRSMRDVVATEDREGLLSILDQARSARVNLPAQVARPEALVELRVPVPDRTGVLADVTTLAGRLDVNIADLEIAHSSEGERGVLIMIIEAEAAERFRHGLVERGYRPAVQALA